jgi:hypothetical protein
MDGCKFVGWSSVAVLEEAAVVAVATVASSMGLGGYGVGGGVSTTNLGVSVEGYGLCLSWWMDGHVVGFSYGQSVMSWQLSSWLRSIDRCGDDWLHMFVSSLLS